jgi:phosphoglycerate dehydrogenase-like enzyme
MNICTRRARTKRHGRPEASQGLCAMLQVAFAGPFPTSLAPAVRRHLATPCEITVGSEAQIASLLPQIEVLVTMVLTAELGRAAARLKLLQVPGAGLDGIDRAAVPSGAMLANAYGHETGIAEYVIGAVLALTREFARVDATLRRGDWHSQWAVGSPPPSPWPELAGKTLGLLGYGHIGQSVARRARAFDMRVCAIRRNAAQSTAGDPALLGGPEFIDEVLRRSDYVVIALPATEATIGCIGRREFGLMKRSAFLINVARAEIVDEQALYDALKHGSIAGAALDVWYRYPREAGPAAPARCPFRELPNVLMTPHVAGWTDGMLEARAKLIAENIRRVAAGETPLNLVA